MKRLSPSKEVKEARQSRDPRLKKGAPPLGAPLQQAFCGVGKRVVHRRGVVRPLPRKAPRAGSKPLLQLRKPPLLQVVRPRMEA